MGSRSLIFRFVKKQTACPVELANILHLFSIETRAWPRTCDTSWREAWHGRGRCLDSLSQETSLSSRLVGSETGPWGNRHKMMVLVFCRIAASPDGRSEWKLPVTDGLSHSGLILVHCRLYSFDNDSFRFPPPNRHGGVSWLPT